MCFGRSRLLWRFPAARVATAADDERAERGVARQSAEGRSSRQSMHCTRVFHVPAAGLLHVAREIWDRLAPAPMTLRPSILTATMVGLTFASLSHAQAH